MGSRQLKLSAKRLYLIFSRKAAYTGQPLKSNIGVGGFLLLSVPVTTLCLGTWQVKRLFWKLNLIEEVKLQNEADPVELPKDLEDLSTMEYRRIHVRGKFDHSKEIFIGPRQRVTKNDKGGGLMSSRPQSGVHIVTPFEVTDKNLTILVNRGWVPKQKTEPSTRPEGQVTEEIDLIGTVRLSEMRPQFCPKNKQDSIYFHYRDVPKMCQLTRAAPIFIDADANSTVKGGPIGGQTRITFRNEHLSYIFTWYALSAATSYMWYRKYIRLAKP